jgi:hypothetical protein
MSENPNHPSRASFPSDADPDPAPERERTTAAEPGAGDDDERDRGGTGEPVGRDNIRDGRVEGVMGGPHQQQGQGQGG